MCLVVRVRTAPSGYSANRNRQTSCQPSVIHQMHYPLDPEVICEGRLYLILGGLPGDGACLILVMVAGTP